MGGAEEQRPAKLRRTYVVRHPLMLEVHNEKLQPIAPSRSNKTKRRLSIDRYIHLSGS
jgi:hypothetical protein